MFYLVFRNTNRQSEWSA